MAEEKQDTKTAPDPKTVWFRNTDTDVVFAVREGSITHARVTAKRNRETYKRTTKPAKG